MKIKISEFKKIIKQELLDGGEFPKNIDYVIMKYKGKKLEVSNCLEYEFPNEELASKAVWEINRARLNKEALRKKNIVTLLK
jgi:hypothetical protein